MSAILSVDFGLKRVGIAYVDNSTNIPISLGIISHDEAEKEIILLVHERKVAVIVFGLPLNEDNSEGPFCIKVRKFARRIQRRIEVKIEFVDEYGTSEEAKELTKGSKDKIDDISALIILREYLKRS